MEKNNEKFEEDFSMYEKWRTYPPIKNIEIIYSENKKDRIDNNNIDTDLSECNNKDISRQKN